MGARNFGRTMRCGGRRADCVICADISYNAEMNNRCYRAVAGLVALIGISGCASHSSPPDGLMPPPATRVVDGTPTTGPTTAPATADLKVLKFGSKSFDQVLAGTQTSTTRKGIRDFPQKIILMQTGTRTRRVEIVRTEYARFGDLTTAQANTDGFATLADLKDSLRKNYPGIGDADETTTIYVRVLAE